MNPLPPIPADHRLLLACLCGAFHNRRAESALRSADWPALLRQARQHGVDTFLYPWLAAQLPDLFSAQASAAADSAPAAWRALFLEAMSRTVLRQRQLADILGACARARIAVVPLKGVWLGEAVYDDPAQRTMADIDLLIRQEDRDACHAQFLALGYGVKKLVLHSDYARDQSYYHASYACCVEVHWHFASKMADVFPVPDLEAVWQNTAASTCCGHPVFRLAPEDSLTHLVQHALCHLLALPLRAYLDIALFLKRFGDGLTPAGLDAAATRWKTGRGTPLLLRVAAALFESALPPALEDYVSGVDPSLQAQACHALFHLPPAKACSGELTLLRFKNAPPLGRLRLVFSRIFMPKSFLVLRYPCARHFCGLPLAWLCRTADLYREKHAKIW